MIAQAAGDEETILTVSVSLEAALRAKAEIDVGGHYSRPDVLQLLVNKRPLERVIEVNPNKPAVLPKDGNGAPVGSAASYAGNH